MPELKPNQITISHPEIHLYDFDGVLASPFEEALYCLPVNLEDQQFIDRASLLFGIGNNQESLKSIRYMMMQATMLEFEQEIKPGPVRPDPSVPFMIITARSDYFSISRMMNFLSDQDLMPIRIFNVGDTPKKETIQTLLDKHPETEFTYWDDRQSHVDGANSLKSSRLTCHLVDNDLESYYEKAESYYRNLRKLVE